MPKRSWLIFLYCMTIFYIIYLAISYKKNLNLKLNDISPVLKNILHTSRRYETKNEQLYENVHQTLISVQEISNFNKRLTTEINKTPTENSNFIIRMNQALSMFPISQANTSCEVCALLNGLPYLTDIINIRSPELNPKIVGGKLKISNKPKYIIAIPSAQRPTVNYLTETLRSILVALDAEHLSLVLIVVQLTGDENFIQNQSANLILQFSSFFESDTIRIIVPPAIYYPSWETLIPTLNDPPKRMKWRTKQVLDYIYLLAYSYGRADYYIQFEDDVISKYNFLTLIDNIVARTETKTPPWIMLDFCSLGFIGKLFRKSELPILASYFSIFYQDKPIDWLLESYFSTKYCTPDNTKADCQKSIKARVVHYTSVFQHIGSSSSLEGKIQKLKVTNFEEKLFLKPHKNPPAQISTTLKIYESRDIVQTYLRNTYFWAQEPKIGDQILINFNQPVHIKKIYIKTGHEIHYQDLLYNTSIELKLANNVTPKEFYKDLLTQISKLTDMNALKTQSLKIDNFENQPIVLLEEFTKHLTSFLQLRSAQCESSGIDTVFKHEGLAGEIVKKSLDDGFIPIGIVDCLGVINIDLMTALNNVTRLIAQAYLSNVMALVPSFEIKTLDSVAVQDIRLKIHTNSPYWITISEIFIA